MKKIISTLVQLIQLVIISCSPIHVIKMASTSTTSKILLSHQSMSHITFNTLSILSDYTYNAGHLLVTVYFYSLVLLLK